MSTPFQNRYIAEKAFKYITGAFAISKLNNEEGWYIISQDSSSNYIINYEDGSTTILNSAENKETFDLLKSQTVGL
jgi:hypothetical protein